MRGVFPYCLKIRQPAQEHSIGPSSLITESGARRGRGRIRAMWWWRKVRKADIPKADRDTLKRFGEPVVGMIIAGGFSPPLPELPLQQETERQKESLKGRMVEFLAGVL